MSLARRKKPTSSAPPSGDAPGAPPPIPGGLRGQYLSGELIITPDTPPALVAALDAELAREEIPVDTVLKLEGVSVRKLVAKNLALMDSPLASPKAQGDASKILFALKGVELEPRADPLAGFKLLAEIMQGFRPVPERLTGPLVIDVDPSPSL